MLKRFLVLLAAMLFVCVPLFSVDAQEDLKRELDALKQRVQQLEEKLKEQEQRDAQTKEAQKEHRKELSAIVEALKGIEIGFSATGVVQGSVGNHTNEGIPSDRDREDRVDGSISADLEISRRIGDHGLGTVILAGAYGDGLDPRIPSWWGINGDAEGEQRVYLKELWYEHELFDGRLIFTLGKVDLTAYVDANEVANDENAQFLSPGFVHSAAIEFPDDNGPGVRVQFIPLELVDISFGWGEGDADWNELGQRSFFIGAVGLHPELWGLQGNYRLYGWYRRHHRDEGFVSWDDQIKGISDSRNGWGLGLSLDQAVTPHVTLFGRVGYQDHEVYEFGWAWSVGAEIKGGYWGRDDDALGIAYGMAMISNDYRDFKRIVDAEPWFTKDESHLELYYRFQLNDHISISPDLQILWNAQGDERFDPVTVIGIRGTLEF
jgi:high affinity Mn2+ porin